MTKSSEQIKPEGRVLDLACGKGRHTKFLLTKGFDVTAVDVEPGNMADLGCTFLCIDLESTPLPEFGWQEEFDAIVVTNYLHRPLLPLMKNWLSIGGIIIYQTFMAGNEQYGKPSSSRFLLEKNELSDSFDDFQIISFSQGYIDTPKPAMTQQICARRI